MRSRGCYRQSGGGDTKEGGGRGRASENKAGVLVLCFYVLSLVLREVTGVEHVHAQLARDIKHCIPLFLTIYTSMYKKSCSIHLR